MPSSVTAQQIIDRARLRHPHFTQDAVPDPVLLAGLDTLQRTFALQYSGAIEGLTNTTVTLALTIGGVLVGVTTNNVPQYLTTYADGWPVQFTVGGTPYIDTSGIKVAGDPFGQNGGVPGFPLPTDFVKIIDASVIYANNQIGGIDIVAEHQRNERQRLSRPVAFISGNRLVPLRPLNTGNSGDAWAQNIASLSLSYVALPVLAALTDLVVIPATLHAGLVAQLAEICSVSAPGLSAAEKSIFAGAARRAEEAIEEFCADLVGAASTSSITYRR